MVGGRFGWLAGALCALSVSISRGGGADSTAFNYQGQLKRDGVPASGAFDLEFRLFDSESGGAQQGSTLSLNDVPVENGLFTVQLDFGAAAFTGEPRWLEVTVDGLPLSPRQPLTTVPYALHAANAASAQTNWSDNGPHVFLQPGNVGIGTEEPATMLHLRRPLADTALRFQTIRFQEGPPASLLRTPASAAAGGPGQVWSSPDLARLSDDQRATVNFSGALGTPDNDQAQLLDISNLGFTIPADAVIVSIRVDVEGQGACGCSDCDRCNIDATVELIGGDTASTQRSLPFGSEAVQPIPHTLEEWGVAFTPEQVNASSFGVRLSGNLDLLDIFVCFPGLGCSYAPCDCTGTGSLGIDAVSVTVFFYDISVTSTPVDWTVGIPAATSALHISPNANLTTPAVYIDTQGHVGINTTAPGTFHLSVTGFAAKTTGTSWTNLSDGRLKKNIEPLNGALGRLLNLRGVSFEFTEEGLATGLAAPGRQMGFIAQDVEPVFPQWINQSDGFKFITESGTTALMVEALRELRAEKDAQIDARGKEIAELKNRLSRLEMVMSGLTSQEKR